MYIDNVRRNELRIIEQNNAICKGEWQCCPTCLNWRAIDCACTAFEDNNAPHPPLNVIMVGCPNWISKEDVPF
jgi:hypothetical protein